MHSSVLHVNTLLVVYINEFKTNSQIHLIYNISLLKVFLRKTCNNIRSRLISHSKESKTSVKPTMKAQHLGVTQ